MGVSTSLFVDAPTSVDYVAEGNPAPFTTTPPLTGDGTSAIGGRVKIQCSGADDWYSSDPLVSLND